MTMNGVVLWSCPQTFRAIVWCEDHGHLAYARGRASFVAPDLFPVAGDLIAFELATVEPARHARAIRVVERDRCPEIAQFLRRGGTPAAASRRASANSPRLRPHLHLAAVS